MKNRLLNIAELLVFIIVLSLSNQVFSASFDCDKASNVVEKLICSDRDLSLSDQTLGELFNAEKEKYPNVVSDQKSWLREKRNLCKTSECLRKVYSDRIEYLKTIENCPSDNVLLIGGWVRIQGDGFEEMKFLSKDGVQTFLSWTHHRPEMIGRWSFGQCTIRIQDRGEASLQFELRVRRLDENRLHVWDIDQGADAIYKRVNASK